MTIKKRIRAERIRSILAEIDESVALIRKHLPDSDDPNEYIRLGIVKDGINNRLEYALQSIFDICAILNRDSKLGIPATDDDVIQNLIAAGIFDKNTGEMLQDMKGLRNILVHQYGKIDDSIVFQILKDHLDDIDVFTNMIESFLDNNET